MRIRIAVPVALTLIAAHVMSVALFAEHPPPLAKAPFNADQANEYQQQWSKHLGKELVYTNSIGMQLKQLRL